MGDRVHEGGCHCGALAFAFRTAVSVADWNVRACQCGFCTRHGALSVSDPAGTLAFDVRDEGALTRYRFGMRTADFLVCARCGVYVGAEIRTGEGAFGIFNARALEPRPANLPAPAPVDYAGEDLPGREARRARRWTPLTT